MAEVTGPPVEAPITYASLPMRISVCVITLNEEANLGRCLDSCRSVADEVVVVDSGSTDATRSIAESHGATWRHHDWKGFVEQKNYALEQASGDWILSLDADEALSTELVSAIAELKRSKNDLAYDWYEVSRLTYHEGRWIRHGDWYPDRLPRLFKRGAYSFVGGKVHERLDVRGEGGLLKGDLQHYSYRDAHDYWMRCAKYARLWAESKYHEGKRVSKMAAVSHCLWCLLKGYFLKRGFLDGYAGFQIAMFSSCATYLKYTLLHNRQNNR